MYGGLQREGGRGEAGVEGGREQQPDTVAFVSADTCRTPLESLRAALAEVSQRCIDVWERRLGRAVGRHNDDSMTIRAKGGGFHVCVCVCVTECF